MRLRTSLARWLIVLSTISPIAFIGGFFLGSVLLMWLAVGILALQLVFALVTLPVEFNASRRAIPLLEQKRLIVVEEEAGVRRVLRAAALTYLVSVARPGGRLPLLVHTAGGGHRPSAPLMTDSWGDRG